MSTIPRTWHTLRRRRLFSTYSAGSNALMIDAFKVSYPYVWLRDSCRSPECLHPSTQQKLFRSSDIPLDIRPTDISFVEDGLHLQWPDGHKSFYPREFLKRYSTMADRSEFHKDVAPVLWNGPQIANAQDLYLPYSSLQSTAGLLAAITQLAKYGLLFITGVPTDRTDDEMCELRKLATRFSEIRPTFYGEVWNVKSIHNSRNIAYTNLDLGLHMDLMYFIHPPRYQILHCLRNRVKGGMSLFVDSFHAANTLRDLNPKDFDILTATPVPFHYINDGHHLHFEHPTIELAPHPTISSPDPDRREVAFVNYSPPFQAPLLPGTPIEFYSALKRFSDMLTDPIRTFSYTLKEGDAVLFDNRRVLHARTAFEDLEGVGIKDGEANRWLKGTYITEDTLWDRGRVLRERMQEML